MDIITFGSPCQDLSVAGKRAGLKHEENGDDETTRSGLFMEAVRIIKEMRKATGGKYPRFAMWENVPGAFSSQKGEDFRVVCEELIKIVEPQAAMPAVPKNGWPYADCYVGDGWSLAYRTFDAQYWGVPQRCRRIYLVADFGGERAGEILFEREGLRGHFATFRTAGQAAPGDAQGRAGAADGARAVGLDIYNLAVTGNTACSLTTATGQGASNTGPSVAVPCTLKIRSGCDGGGKGALIQHDKSATLSALNDQYLFQPVGLILDDQGGAQINVRYDETSPTLRAETHGHPPCVLLAAVENHPADSRVSIDESGKVQTLTSRMGTGGGNVPMVIEERPVCYGCTYQDSTGPLMANTHPGSYSGQDAYQDLFVVGKECPIAIDRAFFNQGANAKFDPQLYEDGTCPTLVARGPAAVCVRRLTPTECARLQGFADRWGDICAKDSFAPEEFRFWREVRQTHDAINGKKRQDYTEKQILTWYNKLATDSAEYKMWGNGIALPTALYCMQGIVDAYYDDLIGRVD